MHAQRIILELDKKDDVIQLRPLGDIHIGNLGCDLEKFQKNIKYILEHENYYTIGMGDYIDNVMAYAGGTIDKRWNPETINRATLTTEEQTDKFIKLWKPISEAKKSFGLHAGNHEWKTINQRRFIKDFCEKLGEKYLGRLSYTCLSFKHNKKIIRDYLILSLHGGYAGMLAGGAVNRMKMFAGDFDFDLALMGHNHDTWTRSGTRLSYDIKTNSPIEKKVLYANTGTFLHGYEKNIDSYVEINPREAKRVGTITITFKPDTGEMFSHE
jgi:hypothetical protein